jgi:hypothetical protein
LGFVDETELGNNETRCSSEKDLLTRSEERNYTKYGQLTGLLPHQPIIGSSIQPINNRSSNTNIKPGENSPIGPQTAVPSSQLQSSIMDDENGRRKVRQDVRVVKQRGQRHHRDVIHESHSFTNDKANEGKNISNRQMMHSMSSQIHEEGCVPMTKHPTRPRTHIEVPNGPQMAIPLIQMQSLDERVIPMSKGSRRHRSDGERRWRRGDDVYENRSFTSDEHTRRAEDPSGLDEEQGTGDVPAIRQAWHSKRQKGAFLNHQMDMASFQAQPSIRSDGPGNGETRRRQGDVINEDRSKVNDESMRRSRGTSAVDKKQGTGNKPDPQLPTRSRTHETSHNGLQTASHASQKKPSIKLKGPRDGETRRRIEDRSSLVTEDSRRDHNSTRTMKRSYMNVEPATNRSGGALVTQGSTCSKTRNGYLYDPQTAVPSSQPQPSRGSSNPVNGEPRGRPGDARYGERTRINGENSRIPKEVVNG